MNDNSFQEIFQRFENEESHSISNFSDVPILSPTARSVDLSEGIFDSQDEPSSPSKIGRVSCSDFLAALQGLDSTKSHKSQALKKNYSEDFQQFKGETRVKTLPDKYYEPQELGSSPCTAFCPLCDEYVHTNLESAGSSVLPKAIARALSPLLQCCNMPNWISGVKVHKCPICDMVLARTSN